jgi:CRP/FNR family transcriptional regulator, anaerobic regulatory protein
MTEESFFKYLQSFRTISPDDQATITRQLQDRSVPEGTMLLKEGKLARELFFISQGILKIVTTNAKGNDVTQFFLKENTFCTILASFNSDQPAQESIIAATDAELLIFTKDSLRDLYQELPWFRELIDTATQKTLLEKIRIRNGFMGEEAATRYQRFLSLYPDIAQRVSLTDIASYLGITPQSLSRIRRQKMR